MKLTLVTAALAAGLATTAMATEMPELARKNNCTACHTIDGSSGEKKLGPAWKDVAAKYKNDPEAEAQLINKVSKGGSGVWGSVPMIGNDPAGKKREQMKELVKFILAL